MARAFYTRLESNLSLSLQLRSAACSQTPCALLPDTLFLQSLSLFVSTGLPGHCMSSHCLLLPHWQFLLGFFFFFLLLKKPLIIKRKWAEKSDENKHQLCQGTWARPALGTEFADPAQFLSCKKSVRLPRMLCEPCSRIPYNRGHCSEYRG